MGPCWYTTQSYVLQCTSLISDVIWSIFCVFTHEGLVDCSLCWVMLHRGIYYQCLLKKINIQNSFGIRLKTRTLHINITYFLFYKAISYNAQSVDKYLFFSSLFRKWLQFTYQSINQSMNKCNVSCLYSLTMI